MIEKVLMKKILISLVIGTLLLVLLLTALPGLPAQAADPVSKVPIYLQPTDTKLLEAITTVGADKEYVELTKDYGLRSDGKSPYSQTYSDLKSDKNFLLVSQLPMVDAEGDKLKPGWFVYDGKFYTNSSTKLYNNLFWAEVSGTQVTLVTMNDQPYGAKQGDQVTYDPQLFLNGNEIHAPPNPTLLGIDPTAPDYHNNILTWD